MPARSSSPRRKPGSPRPAPGSSRVETGEVFVTRQVHFNAAHRLYNPSYDEAWNEEEFGPCANRFGHGHNYVLEATVAGRPDPATGYVINLAELKRILWRAIVEPCDHRHLNEEVDFLKGVIPSTENLVIAFWRRIAPQIPVGRLHRLRLYETPRNYADYFGP